MEFKSTVCEYHQSLFKLIILKILTYNNAITIWH